MWLAIRVVCSTRVAFDGTRPYLARPGPQKTTKAPTSLGDGNFVMELRLARLDPLVDGFFRPALVSADHRVGGWKRLVLLDSGEGDAKVVGDFAARHEADHGLSLVRFALMVAPLRMAEKSLQIK